jgi:hypothetical protein
MKVGGNSSFTTGSYDALPSKDKQMLNIKSLLLPAGSCLP